MSEWWKVYGTEVSNGVFGCVMLLGLAFVIYSYWPEPKKEVKTDE